jgi:NDP-sugar pyrophosphorylase family protein
MSFNIIVSLAGKSQRFFENGFTQPKYFLPMANGKSMIEAAIDTLQIPGQLILIVQQEHIDKYKIDSYLKERYPNAILRVLNSYTQGAAESCYLGAKDLIDNETPLIISNCDQTLEWDSADFIQKTLEKDVDGCVLTFFADTVKNSYARVKENSTQVTEIAEKQVISKHSLVGVHSWKCGSDFCRAAETMFRENIRAKNEYYISISYIPLISHGKQIHIVPLKEEKGEKYWSVGTPDQYFDYLKTAFGSVKQSHLSQMTRGWLIGDFSPSIVRTKDLEVGYLRHQKGEVWPAHLHKVADEYNVLIRGKIIINNETIEQGEIFVIKKGMLTKASFLEDCEVLCIKIPSDTKDKYCY